MASVPETVQGARAWVWAMLPQTKAIKVVLMVRVITVMLMVEEVDQDKAEEIQIVAETMEIMVVETVEVMVTGNNKMN